MTRVPPHPDQIPKIPRTRTARIETLDGWWFHYAVYRRAGIAIPECECSLHLTLKGAQRAARRWTRPRAETRTVAEYTER